MAKLMTTEQIKNIIQNMYNGEYELIGEYINSVSPITLKHKICGNEYSIKRAKSFIRENDCLCPICRKIIPNSTKKLTEEIIIERLKKETGDEYSYIGGFINSNTKLKLRHNLCGNIIETSPHNFFGSKHRRCKYCGSKNRGKYALKSNYLNSLLAEKSYGNEFIWLEKYKDNNKLLHKIKHLTCGYVYDARPNDFQQGYYCPNCTKKRSKEEIEIYDFIKANYNGEIIHNYKCNNLELDIYLPELNIGFEVNGYYWHSTVFKDKNYHINKRNLFLEYGINIYFILDLDWKDKKQIWKNKILYLIKRMPVKHIFARNTIVKYNLDKKSKSLFLNNYHLQGNCPDKFNLYLTDSSNNIYAIMTFGSNRITLNNKNQRLELLRYATNSNYIIVGGFSKLLKHSIGYIKQNYQDFTSIYTYADLDISNGNLYIKNNFILDHISKPSYIYVYQNKKYNRYSFNKFNLKQKFPEYYDEKLSESQIVENIPNLYKIYNCGNDVFRIDI